MKKMLVLSVLLLVSTYTTLLSPATAQSPDDPPVITAQNVDQLEVIGFLLRGPANSLAWSPDGQWLAVASSSGVWMYNTNDLDEEPVLMKNTERHVSSVTFSLDGQLLAITSVSKVLILKVDNGEILQELEGGGLQSGILYDRLDIAFSPDGKLVAAGGYNDSTFRVWEVANGHERYRLEGLSGVWSSIAFSPDGQYLASSGWDGTVKLWDITSGNEARTLGGSEGGWISSVVFSPDGQWIAATGLTGIVQVWEVNTGRELQRQPQGWHSVAFSPDGTLIATATDYMNGPNVISVRDAADGSETLRLKGHTLAIRDLAFSPDGQRMASADQNNVVIWDMADGHQISSLSGYMGAGYSEWEDDLAVSTSTVAAGFYGTPMLWDIKTGQFIKSFENSDVRSIEFSSDGQLLACGYNGYVEVWGMSSGRERYTLEGYAGGITSLVFSSDGQWIAFVVNEQSVVVAEAAAGQPVWQTTISGVNSVGFSPDGTLLAAWSPSGGVRFLETASGNSVGDLLTQNIIEPLAYPEVVFSPDVRWLAAGSWNWLWLWDLAGEGEPQEAGTAFGWDGGQVAFSPNGELLAWSSMNTIMIFDMVGGHELCRFNDHIGVVTDLKFSLDGRWFVSTSTDGTIRLWGIRDNSG
jgi:WD40 repeat protein